MGGSTTHANDTTDSGAQTRLSTENHKGATMRAPHTTSKVVVRVFRSCVVVHFGSYFTASHFHPTFMYKDIFYLNEMFFSCSILIIVAIPRSCVWCVSRRSTDQVNILQTRAEQRRLWDFCVRLIGRAESKDSKKLTLCACVPVQEDTNSKLMDLL